ncbi:hypothetical protein SAMN04488688_102139 [Paenibacillus sp. cl141a]|uniref:hypothetical protein n=1 Tax=Paenibacillus TaxID=44249 RepID=UPI0008D874A0|nr:MULTISPECIES: hypothetical protein [Paenibacillus]PCL91037.1 hypothetical protein CPZ30_24800 [Paenibacillus lautus]QOT10276.1 hypothetical protein JNUCC32_30050 [Paenibacillus sp. JNUCC-32]SEK74121.1 hypothetical protein SAMN04488688_102139 [Paenibacillus sp. cl141a]
MNKDPYGQLASSLYASLNKQTRQAMGGVGAVLGTITSTGLKLDDFKHELQDYMVAELPGMLSLPRYTAAGTATLGGQPQEMTFDVEENEVEDTLFELGKGLKPGDRVLAVRVNSGNDVVVVCKVVSSGG